MPEWETLLWIFFGIVMTAVTVGGIVAMRYMSAENRRYSAEGKLWSALAQAGQPVEGVIRNVRMHPGNMTRGGSAGQTVCALVFDVDYTDNAGTVHATSIHTFVEDALVPQFLQPRKAIHLRYDAGNPAAVAIDRERTPLEIPRVR
jgi:hypothetical protein